MATPRVKSSLKDINIIFLFLQTVSPYQWKIWLDFCLYKVRFPKLNHDILPGYRGQGKITDRPRSIAIEPMQTEISDTFLFSRKRFILVSNERVHYLLSYLNFFSSRMLDYSTFLYWLSWKRASRHLNPNLLRDWVIACFGSRNKTFQKWKSSGLGTWLRTPRSNISLTFPEKKSS